MIELIGTCEVLEAHPTHITSRGENFTHARKKGKKGNKVQSYKPIKFNIGF